ncbi:MAG: YfhO family protein, partial [Oscillospiraceae bacterium]|nr:YfhO family protein [Oscillospiraceae bacterium]
MNALLVKLKTFLLGKHKKRDIMLISFFLTAGVLLIAFAARQFAPFGKNSLMAMDAYGQYFPMLRAMRSALHSGSGFEYSFTGACGYNLWIQNAYYTNSPLWLPLYFVPYSWMPAVTDLIVALRLCLASAFFSLWLMRGSEKSYLTVVLFSLCYGLCGWALAFINQFMWADAYMLLPLTVLGIERIFKGKSIFLYTLSLGLTLWSNFYIGYMICIFSVMCFLFYLIGNRNKFRKKLIIAARFSLASLLTGGIAAAVLIPVYIGLQNTIASTLTFDGTLELYHSAAEILKRLLPLQETALEFQAPNLYCGLLCIPLALCALFSREISLSKKIAFSFGILFLLISFNLNILDFLWHGLHYPNQLPGRQSFLFSFMIVSAAYRGLETLLHAPKQRTKTKRVAAVFICLALATELAVNSFWTVGTQVWSSNLVKYTAYDRDMKDVLKKYSPGYKDFWRCELLTPGNNNAGQLYGFNGISYYSSTMSEAAYKTFESLGTPIYAQNVSTKYESSPILNSVFGIRYLFDRGENSDKITDYMLYGLELKEEIGSIKVYENKYCLPLGFTVSSAFENIDISKHNVSTQALNNLVKSASETDKNIIYYQSEKKSINSSEFQRFYEELSENGMTVKSFSSTKITGSINSNKNGLLFLSIPN